MALTCSNCGEPHGDADVFCESCGFDFITGTLPEPEPPVTSLGLTPATPTVAGAATEVVTIAVDRAFYARMDTDGVLEFPNPEPDQLTVEITGDQVLIGRERPSRNIFPDIDVAADPAVSSRHALLARRPDGSWQITDLGSTNGTYIADSTVAITPHVPVPVAPGTPIFVGAWTRLDLNEAPGIA